MQVYFKNSFVSLYYDKNAKLGKAVWSGHLRGSELREAFLLCLDLVDRFNLTKWLADDRQMKTIEAEDLKWSLEVYVPQMASSPLLRMARLPSQYEQNREAVDIMIEKGHASEINLSLRNFECEQEAMAWLQEPL